MASFCRGDDDALLLHDCDEHLLLSSMLYSSLTAKGAAGALLDEAGVASVRSFQIEAGKGAGVGAASASLNKVLVEVVGVVLLVTKNGLHASDELIVVVVIKKGFAVVTVCEASAEAVEAAAAATVGAVARVAEDTLLDLVVDATNACQTGPRTFGTTAAAAATAIVVSLVSKVSFLLGEASVILRSSRNSRLFFVIACCKRR